MYKKYDQLADDPFTLPFLPYAHYILRLPHSLTDMKASEMADTLQGAYMTLLDLVFATAQQQFTASDITPGGPSYNVIFTLEHMHIIPRLQESHKLRDTGESLSINSLGFAGMFLVKCDTELDAVKAEGVRMILSGVSMRQMKLPSFALQDDDT